MRLTLNKLNLRFPNGGGCRQKQHFSRRPCGKAGRRHMSSLICTSKIKAISEVFVCKYPSIFMQSAVEKASRGC